jgi:hypothetical protein
MSSKGNSLAYKTVYIGNIKMTLFSLITVCCGIASGLFLAYKVHPFIGLLMIGSTFVAAYNLNCVIVGHCRVFAWILVTLYVLNTVLAFLPYILAFILGSGKSRSSSSRK